ncbi:MAG TPA: hypothetical protein VF216_00535 [Mizugakiibacter sp.]
MAARKLALAYLAGAVLVGLATRAQAAPLQWGVDLGVEHSDNIRLTPTDETAATALVPSLLVAWQDQGARYRGALAGSFSYYHYLQGDIGNQWLGDASGKLDWLLLPGRLYWAFEDYVGEEPVDVLQASTPENTQRSNVFVTGPTVSFRLGAATELQTDLRYINSTANKTDLFNTDRGQAAVHLLHDVSPLTKLSLNVSGQDVRFREDALKPDDYRRYDAFGGYEYDGPRLHLKAAAGASKINFDDGRDFHKPYAQALGTFTLTPRGELTFELDNRLYDAAEDLMARAPDPARFFDPLGGVSMRTTTISPDVYMDKEAQLGSAWRGSRLEVRFGGYWRKQEFLTLTNFDQRSYGPSLNVLYALTPATSLSAFATRDVTRYTTSDREDHLGYYGVTLGHQLAQHWSVGVGYSRRRQTSTDPSQEYTENRVLLTLSYRPAGV